MDQEPVAAAPGHDVQVIDPDVRSYVYTLVTAVCPAHRRLHVLSLTGLARRFQWREPGPLCLGRRCSRVPARYQTMAQTLRREE